MAASERKPRPTIEPGALSYRGHDLAGRVIGVSGATMRRLWKAGRVQALPIGATVVYARAELERFLQAEADRPAEEIKAELDGRTERAKERRSKVVKKTGPKPRPRDGE